MQQPKQDPFIVTVVRPEAPETTVGDVILGSLGLAGVLLMIALVLGAVVALVLIGWHKLRPPSDDHLPPVSPLVPPSAPPSSQSR